MDSGSIAANTFWRPIRPVSCLGMPAKALKCAFTQFAISWFDAIQTKITLNRAFFLLLPNISIVGAAARE